MSHIYTKIQEVDLLNDLLQIHIMNMTSDHFMHSKDGPYFILFEGLKEGYKQGY